MFHDIHRRRRSIRFFVSATIPIVLVSVMAVPAVNAQIWSEEFNAGSAPDQDIWSYDTGDWGWGNAELQNYTTNSENSRIEDGQLIITALREGDSFTSARIKTQDKLTFTYGTVEARIQTPDLGDGLWPAFWTLGNSFPSVGWPACGEIDVLEMGSGTAIGVGLVNSVVGSAAHWESNGAHRSSTRASVRPSDLNGTFHTYRMEWTPTSISTYIDGESIWTLDISDPETEDLTEFHEPHFFILNLAVGGTYTGIDTAGGITAPFPAEYRVDYIRIYDNGYTVLGGSSTESPLPPDTNLLDNAGFESGLTNWTLNLGGGTAAASTDYAHEGTQALMIDSTGAGDWASPNLSQRFPASTGALFSMEGYMLNPAGSPIAGDTHGLFKIEFRDHVGTLLEPDVELGTSTAAPWFGAASIPVLSEVSPTDTWLFSEVRARAPEGTAEVLFIILNVNEPGNPGPIYYDDVQAILHGEPVQPFTLTSSVSGGNIQISFPTQDGFSYQVGYKVSLTNESWMPVDTIVGDGNTNSVTYAATNRVGFYRVSTP